jgi:putative ABC transport system permease protein
MNLRQSFKMALKSIWSNKVRSALTMLGIIIGVAAVIILVSVVRGQNVKMKEYYESMGTNKVNISAYVWNGKDVTQDLYDFCLGQSDIVTGVTPNMQTWGDIKYRATNTNAHPKYYGSPPTYLASDQYSKCNNFTIEKGRDLSFLDVKTYNQVMVIGAELANYLFQYKNPIGEKVSLRGYTFEVIGVYKAKDTGANEYWSLDYLAVIPYTMSRLLDSTTTITEFTAKIANAESVNKAIARFNDFLTERVPENAGYFYVYSENQWMEQSDEQNKLMSNVLGGIAAISLLVGGIGIMNIMLVTVRERTREIGIRKAIGGSRRTILIQFLIEAAVVCAVGGVIGILLGGLGTVIAGKKILDILIFPSFAMTVGSFAFSVALGITFGMYPAVKASGLQPVEALRAE